MSLPCSTSPVASTSKAHQDTTAPESSSSKEPQPGPSHSDDPKPGPSTTAAEFDLEVFDSGSSCSLEDAWGLGCSPDHSFSDKVDFNPAKTCPSLTLRTRRKVRRAPRSDKKKTISDSFVGFLTTSTLTDFDNSSEDNGDLDDEMSLPSCPFDPQPVSMCPSETEEAATDHEDDLEDQDDLEDEQDEVDEPDKEEEDEEEGCTCGETCWKCVPSTSAAAVTVDPSSAETATTEVESETEFATSKVKVSPSTTTTTTTAAASSAAENIDEIVQDHDNFGTDENEDSLDSLALASGSVSISLYRPDSEDSIEDDLSLFGAPKRKNVDETDRVSDDSEQPTVKKKKKSSSLTASPEKKFELVWNSDNGDEQQQQQSSAVATRAGDCNGTEPCEAGDLLEQEEQQLSQLPQQQQQQHVFFAEDHNLEHEVCSPVPAASPVTCSTPAGSKTAAGSSAEDVAAAVAAEQLPPPSAAIVSWVETFSRWSHADKIVAIDQLINACHPTQVRHMMAVIEPQFQRDFISLLPKELALYVLSFLEPRDLLRAAQTCRYWRILAEDNLLWREKCREAGLTDVLETLNIRRRKTSPSGFTYSTWKSGFMRQHNIEMNWRVLPVRPPRVLKGHDDHVITCLQFSGNRIVSGSDDNTLKVWNATTGKCLKTLVGHTGGVWSSQMEGNIIVSGSTDRTLKVWNADTGTCIHTLYGHTSTVRCMHLHNNRVVSGSRDATLRMWDIDSGECLHVLMGHVAAVRCVQYDGRLVVSGAYDYMVKVWNPETEECLHTLSGHTNRVYSLQFDGVHVVSGSLDTSIRVWDVETGACKHALMGHQSLTSGMELRDNILVSGNADSTVKVWDITTGQCLQTLSGPNKHQSAVTCLQFNSKFVITSSDDGTVKLWDVKTGDFLRDLVALESGGSGGVVWRIRANATKLVCAVGSRNGTEETKLLVLDFDVLDAK